MSETASSSAQDFSSRVLRLQIFTIWWMSVEALVSLVASWMAHSPALLAFGGDSAIELLSAAVVLWRFQSRAEPSRTEERAARIAGGLLFVLAVFVGVTSGLALMGYREPKSSLVGIVVLALAAIVMPWLASQKRKLATATGKCLSKSRRGRVRSLWLYVLDCAGRLDCERGLGEVMG